MKAQHRRPVAVGFVVTPEEIAGRVQALDAQIARLDGDIRASTSPKLSTAWRTEWDAFVRRWTGERDAYAGWSARLFATRVLPRLDSFRESYEWWARDYQRRTGSTPAQPAPRPSESLIPDSVWWAAGLVFVAAFLLGRERR